MKGTAAADALQTSFR